MSMDYSEPECEVNPNEEHCRKSSFQRTLQHPCVPGKQQSWNDSIENWFQDQSNDLTTWEDHKSNMCLEKENERKSIPREIAGLNAVFKEGRKAEISEGTRDEVDKRLGNPNTLRPAPNEDTSNVLDDSSTAEEFENEFLSVSIFDGAAESGDDFSSLDLEGTDSEIQVAVNEIRKEAEKIDTILVLDQFRTLQTEFDSITKKCSLKTMENEELKMQLQESENRVAHMELERDLHHADAEKLREDLKTVVSKMFDISMYESLELMDGNTASIKGTMNCIQSEKRLGDVSSPINTSSQYETYCTETVARNRDLHHDKTSAISSRREKIRIIGLVDQPQNAIRRSPPLSDRSLLLKKPHGQWNHSSEDETTHLLRSSPENQALRSQNVFRKRGIQVGCHIQIDSVRAERQSVIGIRSDGTGKDFERTILCHLKTLSPVDTHSTSLVTEICEEENEREYRRCGMLFRRRNKQRSFSKEDVSILKRQIHQLNETMKMSLAASETLRKRLKIISRYYDGVINKLRTKVDEAKKGRSRAQDDLVNLASQVDLERRLEQSNFEYELRRKDKEIEKLKAGID